MPSTRKESHFRTTQHHSSTYSPHKFTEYVSQRTGMRVVVMDQEGPKVLGYFAAATEITDDSGSPHTLEHLCFMGSKTYPYKGLLDKLATRAYSTTNAWTATDHTAYTLETAGYAAFAQMLPVYLDHVVLPTLTDEACYTEVHHINGEGHDAGVVYSEMQGVQNQQAELMELRGKRLMYPEGIGFRYETGGMMEHLRVLTADRIRQFHRDMYQPKNLCVTVVGEIDHDDLLQILDKFEDTILDDIPKPDAPFKRPWLESPQPPQLKESIRETVTFPEEDESMGEVSIKYFGPHCENVLDITALAVLLNYLAGSSASVLDNAIVEKEQLASAVVHYAPTSRPNSIIEFGLSGVDAGKLAEVEGRFHELLKETSQKALDMTFLRDCLDRERRQLMLQAETTDYGFTQAIISTFLFSDTRDLGYLKSLDQFDELQKWSESQWREFLKKWFTDNKYVTILGKPSAALSKKIREDEEARVAAQIKKLGPDGLKKLGKQLDDAKAHNDREIPAELLEKFKVPGTDTIHFITTTPARSGAARKAGPKDNAIQKIIDQDKSDLPLFIHFEHVPSNFVNIHLLICTANIPVSLRPLLPIYLENFFNAPIQRDGKRIDFEQVVMELRRDTVDFDMRSGGGVGNNEILDINLQVEIPKYATAIAWIRNLLWNGLFDVERILSITARLLADIPDEKRDGSDMSYAVANMVNEAPESIERARNTLVKALYLKRIKKLLASEPENVIQRLEELRSAICDFSNFRILVVTNVEKLKEPVFAWETLAKGKDTSKPLLPLDKKTARFSEAGKTPGKLSYIIPMHTSDSSFAISVAKGPEDPKDPRVPALMVAIAYLDAVEGPLWTAVRGTGLAYGTGFRRRVGRLEFSVYRSPDSYKAFATSKKVLENFVSGTTKFDSLALEGAVSSIVLAFVSQQSTIGDAATEKFVLEVVKDLPRDWNDVILERVRAITPQDVKKAMKDMLLPLFDPSSSNLFVTCASIMEQELTKGLKELGFEPEVRNLASFQDDYGLKVGDEEDDEDDEEDEDGDHSD